MMLKEKFSKIFFLQIGCAERIFCSLFIGKKRSNSDFSPTMKSTVGNNFEILSLKKMMLKEKFSKIFFLQIGCAERIFCSLFIGKKRSNSDFSPTMKSTVGNNFEILSL